MPAQSLLVRQDPEGLVVLFLERAGILDKIGSLLGAERRFRSLLDLLLGGGTPGKDPIPKGRFLWRGHGRKAEQRKKGGGLAPRIERHRHVCGRKKAYDLISAPGAEVQIVLQFMGARPSSKSPFARGQPFLRLPAAPMRSGCSGLRRCSTGVTSDWPEAENPAQIAGEGVGAGVSMCPREDSNLHGLKRPHGPQPCASTNSATRACVC